MVRHVEEKKQMKQAAEAGSGKPQKKKEADSRQQSSYILAPTHSSSWRMVV